MLRPPSPAGAEVEFLDQLECVNTLHAEVIAHVRQLAVRPPPTWFGMLGGYNRSPLYIHESIGDEKRVASNFSYFLIGQIVRIPLLGNASNQSGDSLFIKYKDLFVCL